MTSRIPTLDYPPVINEKGCRLDREGNEICGAPILSHPGRFCARRFALNAINKRCPSHGANMRAGMASATTKTGKSSKYLGRYMQDLPKRMLDGVENGVNDPRLTELRYEIAIVQERIADLLRRVDNGESGHLWIELQRTYQELRSARRSGDEAMQDQSFQALGTLIERGKSDYQAWEEISKQLDRKQRLSESERKREIEANQLAPADQTLMLIQNLVRAVMECVIDTQTRAAIQSRFNTILATGFDPGQYRTLLPNRGDVRDGEIVDSGRDVSGLPVEVLQ